VLGSSDARGEEVKERPVAPSELIGGMYQLLGIDPEARLPHPQGEVVKAYPEPPDAAAPTQWLKEIT
jgi:hypothetical protein